MNRCETQDSWVSSCSELSWTTGWVKGRLVLSRLIHGSACYLTTRRAQNSVVFNCDTGNQLNCSSIGVKKMSRAIRTVIPTNAPTDKTPVYVLTYIPVVCAQFSISKLWPSCIHGWPLASCLFYQDLWQVKNPTKIGTFPSRTSVTVLYNAVFLLLPSFLLRQFTNLPTHPGESVS